MAERCGACGSADTSTGGANFSCLDCNAKTDYDGNVIGKTPVVKAPAPKVSVPEATVPESDPEAG